MHSSTNFRTISNSVVWSWLFDSRNWAKGDHHCSHHSSGGSTKVSRRNQPLAIFFKKSLGMVSMPACG